MQEPNWFRRNWKWAVPVGCLGMLLLAIGAMSALLVFVFSVIRESDVYSEAVARARAHPALVEVLGEPVEEGMVVSGNIQVTGPSGHADIAIPMSGPRGEATLYVVAEREAGQWRYRRLELEDASGRRTDLLATH